MSRRAADCRTSTATHGRSPDEPASRTGMPGLFAQELHRAAAQRGRLDPSTKTVRPLDSDPPAPVPGAGAAWARVVGPRTHRLHSRTVHLDSTYCSARARRSPSARSSSGRSSERSGSRCTRRSMRSTPSAGRSSTTLPCWTRRTPWTGSSRSIGGCRGAADGGAGAPRFPPTRRGVGSFGERCRPQSLT